MHSTHYTLQAVQEQLMTSYRDCGTNWCLVRYGTTQCDATSWYVVLYVHSHLWVKAFPICPTSKPAYKTYNKAVQIDTCIKQSHTKPQQLLKLYLYQLLPPLWRTSETIAKVTCCSPKFSGHWSDSLSASFKICFRSVRVSLDSRLLLVAGSNPPLLIEEIPASQMSVF